MSLLLTPRYVSLETVPEGSPVMTETLRLKERGGCRNHATERYTVSVLESGGNSKTPYSTRDPHVVRVRDVGAGGGPKRTGVPMEITLFFSKDRNVFPVYLVSQQVVSLIT